MNQQRKGDSRVSRAAEEARRWSTVVLLVLVVWLAGYQIPQLSGVVDSTKQQSSRTEISANAAAEAAAQAKKILEDAIAQSRSGGSVDTTAVVSALASIHRIELAICGGPCPDK